MLFRSGRMIPGASPSSLLQQSSSVRSDLYPSCCVCRLHSPPPLLSVGASHPPLPGSVCRLQSFHMVPPTLLCADGGHTVCPGWSLFTGRLRAAGQNSEGCTSGAWPPWRGPPTRSSHSLALLAAPSQVNLRIVPGLTPWAEQEVLDFFPSLQPSPGWMLNRPFP